MKYDQVQCLWNKGTGLFEYHIHVVRLYVWKSKRVIDEN